MTGIHLKRGNLEQICHSQPLEEKKKLYQHIDFELLDSRTVKQYSLSHLCFLKAPLENEYSGITLGNLLNI